MKKLFEKEYIPVSGYWILFLLLLIVALALFSFLFWEIVWLGASLLVIAIFILPGFFYINPNGSIVLLLFGDYKGTVKNNGLFWVNPFFGKKSISLRARNFDSERVKVNDKRGNPVLISVILVWRVQDTYKAAFEVDNYESFVRIQSDAAVRNLAGLYSYDNFDDEQQEVTLRSGLNVINDDLEHQLSERLAISGIEVMEARIGYLAYSPEIASAMLKRQQAEAIVAARFKIVEGAVLMVEDALEQLAKKGVLELAPDERATMVSNLMVVLCSDREVTPIIDTGNMGK